MDNLKRVLDLYVKLTTDNFNNHFNSNDDTLEKVLIKIDNFDFISETGFVTQSA
jgi:hypothetical protein